MTVCGTISSGWEAIMGSRVGGVVDPVAKKYMRDKRKLYIRSTFSIFIAKMYYSGMQLIPLPSLESTDPELAKSLMRLKNHLSICISTLQPLAKWGPLLPKRGIIDASAHDPQHLVDLLNGFLLEHPVANLFDDPGHRTEIIADKDLACKVMSLLILVPWNTHREVETDELTFIRTFPWSRFPEEWEPWKKAIELLDAEAQRRLFIAKYPKQVPSPYSKEPFTDAGVKFVERDEHFWWVGRDDDDEKDNSHLSPLKDDKTVFEEEVTKKVEMESTKMEKVELKNVEPVVRPTLKVPTESLRGELFEWTAGGDCIA